MAEKPATLLAHGAELEASGDVAPPSHQTSLFTFHSYAEMRAAFAGESAHPVCRRGDSPTVRELEGKVARLEHEFRL